MSWNSLTKSSTKLCWPLSWNHCQYPQTVLKAHSRLCSKLSHQARYIPKGGESERRPPKDRFLLTSSSVRRTVDSQVTKLSTESFLGAWEVNAGIVIRCFRARDSSRDRVVSDLGHPATVSHWMCAGGGEAASHSHSPPKDPPGRVSILLPVEGLCVFRACWGCVVDLLVRRVPDC